MHSAAVAVTGADRALLHDRRVRAVRGGEHANAAGLTWRKLARFTCVKNAPADTIGGPSGRARRPWRWTVRDYRARRVRAKSSKRRRFKVALTVAFYACEKRAGGHHRRSAWARRRPGAGPCAADTTAVCPCVQSSTCAADGLRQGGREGESGAGLENTRSAEDNARIIERVNSAALKVFYDVGNATNAGFVPVKEIRWLGKKRIATLHLKDCGWLGEGKIDLPGVMQAPAEIGYKGWADSRPPTRRRASK